MKNYKTKEREIIENILDTITCDICKNTYAYHGNNDIMEIQEFVNIRFTGGYVSIFGDGNVISCDICQHCLKEKLGKYLIIDNSNQALEDDMSTEMLANVTKIH